MRQRAFAAWVALGLVLWSIRCVALEDFIVGGDRPVLVQVPPGYEPSSPAPLVLGLHGFTDNGEGLETYFQFGPVAASLGLLYAHPYGTRDTAGDRFWNATPACCNLYASTVDDSGYLAGVIREIQGAASVDPDRIFLFGHSNGGFMSHRLACDHAETIAAIASLAGATFLDAEDCQPAAPVHVLQIHGTADDVVRYPGGNLGDTFGLPPVPSLGYPGAVATVEQWAAHNGCSLELEYAPRLDLNTGLPGNETLVTRYASVCTAGGSSELWTVQGGNHGPLAVANFSEILARWFLKHPKGLATRATFTLTPASGACPLNVAVDASGSTAVAGTAVASYQWNFGDGATAEGTAAAHTYGEPGRHIVTLTITTDAGQIDSVSRPVEVSCPPGDISPWMAASIGEPSIPGSAWLEASGGIESLRICAAGNVFWGKSDEGFFAYQELSKDFTISAKISEATATTLGACVGLMFRQSLSPDAGFAAVLLELNPAPSRIGIVRLSLRRAAGQSSLSRGPKAVSSLPIWLKVERSGDVFRGWQSLDGESWSLVHEQTIAGLPETLLGGVAAAGKDSLPESDAFLPLQAAVSELSVIRPVRFHRGDSNGDGTVDISDPLAILGYLFLGTKAPGCLDAADVDDAGTIDVSDPVYSLMFLFIGGPAPAEPFRSCGADGTSQDELDCETYLPCRA